MLLRMKNFPARSAQWDEALSRHQSFIGGFHEAMLSLNIVYAFGYAILLYISNNQRLWIPRSDLGYYLSRSAVRVDDILGVESTAAVSTTAVGRFDYPVHRIGLEFTLLVSIAGVAVLTFLLLRFWVGRSVYWFITGRLAVLSALFAGPACYLWISALTWKWGFAEASNAIPLWRTPQLIIFTSEILILSILSLFRRRPFGARLVISFLFLHYGFWMLVLWPSIPVFIYQPYTPYLLVFAFPLAGITWLLYTNVRHTKTVENDGRARTQIWPMATAAAVVALLLIVWLPARKYNLADSKDTTSLKIDMSRGPCRGTCPEYTLRIHGDGLVEYDGAEFVKIKGHDASKISHEQLIRILRSLDRVGFTGLEDRAFNWCFDSSSVAVSVLVDGRAKQVVSDGGCVGAKSSPQDQFVQTARDIDVAVGSAKWILCDGGPCRR
jgi:hypothetical protein